MIIKTQQSVKVERRPYSPLCSIECVGTVAATQDYNGDLDEYIPNYEIAPLTLRPSVSIPGVGNGNRLLSNIRWTLAGQTLTTENITDGTRQLYDISGCAEGSETSGTLVVMTNAQPGQPLRLVFLADLVDTGTGQTVPIRAEAAVRCTYSATQPVITADCCTAAIYDPLRSERTRTITATLMIGTKECAAAKRLFVWEVWDASLATAAWRAIDPAANPMDYWASISADTAALTIDQHTFRHGQRIRVRAKYDLGGNPSSVALTETSPCKEFNFRRTVRDITAEMAMPGSISPSDPKVRAQAIISDRRGTLTEAQVSSVFAVRWKTKPNATGSYSLAATGQVAQLPTSVMNSGGMMAQMEVEDMGPLLPWADSDGKLLTDGDGKILLIK